MVVPVNPKLSDVVTEFLAPGGTPLSQFLRGGPYVPNTAQNAGMPTALPINLSQLIGSARTPPNHTVATSPASSTVSANRGDTINRNIAAVVTNGLGPFSYAWSWVSGGASITLTNATSQTCQIISSTTPGPIAINRTGTLRCVVTDNGMGGYQAFADCPVNWTWEGV